MAPPPAKIKALLGTIKTKYLADDVSASSLSTDALFEGLVQMELLLRGVLVQDESKLWQNVQTSIGKPLLDESNLPKPLLAGANLIAGRVAEAWAASRSETTKYQVEAAILQRTKDIPDPRWSYLLQQDASALDIALGYLTKAATIQKDTPPMWKKVWDVWALQSKTLLQNQENSSETQKTLDFLESETPFEAQTALEALIRIAESKGNTKRASELRVRLLSSYLHPRRIVQEETRAPLKKSSKEDLPGASGLPGNLHVLTAYGDDSTAKLPQSLPSMAHKAKILLDEIKESSTATEDLTKADRGILHVLAVRVGLALEEARVEEDATAQHQLDENRSVHSTLEGCRAKCRKALQLETEDPLEAAANDLQHLVLSTWNAKTSAKLDDDEIQSYWISSITWLRRVIERWQQHGLTQIQHDVSKYQSWEDLCKYLKPFLLQLVPALSGWTLAVGRKERMQQLMQWVGSMNEAELSLLSTIALAQIQAHWMTLSTGQTSVEEEVMKFILDLLSALIHQEAAVQKNQAPKAVGSSTQTSSLSHQWKVARSYAIATIAQDNTLIGEQVAREGIATKSQEHSALGVLQCFVAWSGWYQRPWASTSSLTEVRRLVAHAQTDGERSLGFLESLLLNMASADAELLNGGFLQRGQTLYDGVLTKIETSTNEMSGFQRSILQSHCYNGLARIEQMKGKACSSRAYEMACKSLGILEGLEVPEPPTSFHIWNAPSIFASACTHQRSASRQLIAESLIMQERSDDARVFLEAAVEDAPMDPDAALALGAFLLRMAFYSKKERTPEGNKAAQIQLMKAAKLDSSRADPFALLGLLFEAQGDPQRAQGCYTKALNLDPCNPIAGRGFLRFVRREDADEYLSRAININKPLCGWAWRAVGLNKIFLEAADDFAVVALLKALRCRDVECPANEQFGIFFGSPNVSKVNEKADSLADLAMCYRRLGRFTASIRAFHAAIESAEDKIASEVLCSCAQVELELSLFEEAAERFALVLQREEGSSHSIAAYGQGVALHSIAQRDLEDGKAGSAFENINKAIQSCEHFAQDFTCTQKLLGDLYSFGATLPPNVFHGSNGTEVEAEGLLQRQLDFVKQGETAYLKMFDLQQESDLQSRAASKCDVGASLLLQSQIVENQSQRDGGASSEAITLRERALEEFKAALELDPLSFTAWCGLGCSSLQEEPLLAQHAFSRSLQIEQMFPDGYANIGFLYTNKNAFQASKSVMNALTQVADTPMMWMNRAFMLERDASDSLMRDDKARAGTTLVQAADAYRAALQVMKHPESQLGLAMTSRIGNGGSGVQDKPVANDRDSVLRKESLSLVKEYQANSCRQQDTVSLFEGFLAMEQATGHSDSFSWSYEEFKRGEKLITSALDSDQSVEQVVLSPAKAAIGSTGISGTVEEAIDKPQIEFSLTLSLQRQILHEPNRPDLWVSLAKEFIASPRHSEEPSVAAAAAIDRASKMMMAQLTNPNRTSGRGLLLVKSTDLSEALALSHWLRQCLDDGNKEANEDGKIQTSFDLQRSLIMDPTNRMAREALNEL